jgi:photosystem II PsbU protein
MKFWRSLFTILGIVVFSSSLLFSQPAQALNLTSIVQTSPHLLAVENERRNVADDFFANPDFADKIDINNSSIRDFRELKGFYPNLAASIVQNAPYNEVDDVLSIPGLSDTQIERLKANLDKFTVNPPTDVFIEGDERYNPGLY